MYADGMTTRQIGEAVNVPSRTIHRYLKKAGVTFRNPGAPHHSILSDGAWLRVKYLGEELSTTQIAEIVGCTPRVVNTWLERHNIPARTVGSDKGHKRFTAKARHNLSLSKRGKCVGADNPNWGGGRKNRDPERNRYQAKAWSKAVKERDGCCQECGATERLHAHHIKGWKDYPDLRYDLENGVTLCHSCHELAHGVGFKFRWPQ